MLDAVATVPTVNPAVASAPVAAPCVKLTTSGTDTCAGPVDTMKSTAVASGTSVPPAGDWLSTSPAGTVRLEALPIDPTTRLADVIALAAAAWERLSTLGTAACGGPDDTTKVTELPGSTREPAGGV